MHLCSWILKSRSHSPKLAFLSPPPFPLFPIPFLLFASYHSPFSFSTFPLLTTPLLLLGELATNSTLMLKTSALVFFCGTEQDSLPHILISCPIVFDARRSFFLLLGPLPSPPSSPSLLASFPSPLPLLCFNFAVWNFRKQALAARVEQTRDWLLGRIVELAKGFFLSCKAVMPRNCQEMHHA